MKMGFASYRKVFTPKVMAKVAQTFDRATMVIVSACWGGAILIMLFALYTVNLSIESKRQVTAAAAGEPNLPKLVTGSPTPDEIKPILDRLQKRFSDITFSFGGDKSLTVTCQDGNKFRLWLTVLSYIDTISPQFRWQIKEFCVGLACGSSTPMRAVLLPQKITFTSASEKAK